MLRASLNKHFLPFRTRSGSTTSVKEKRSGKGAKVATARARTGHSLYPEESEAEHVTSSARGIDRCSELLYHLLDRKKGQ